MVCRRLESGNLRPRPLCTISAPPSGKGNTRFRSAIAAAILFLALIFTGPPLPGGPAASAELSHCITKAVTCVPKQVLATQTPALLGAPHPAALPTAPLTALRAPITAPRTVPPARTTALLVPLTARLGAHLGVLLGAPLPTTGAVAAVAEGEVRGGPAAADRGAPVAADRGVPAAARGSR